MMGREVMSYVDSLNFGESDDIYLGGIWLWSEMTWIMVSGCCWEEFMISLWNSEKSDTNVLKILFC